MEWLILREYRYVFFALVGICWVADALLLRRHRRRKAEPFSECLVRILGSNFFILYIGFRILAQWHEWRLYPDGISAWRVVNFALIMATFGFFGAAYLWRSVPVATARGFREIIYPLFCAGLPFAVYESANFFDRFPAWQGSALFSAIRPFRSDPALGAISIALLLLGNALTAWSACYLRRSFSIMTEVRDRVANGPYRFVRHPMYVGESLATIGFCLFRPSCANIGLTVIFLACQRIRAAFEEHKLTLYFPDYAAYRDQTPAYFPMRIFKLRQRAVR